METVTYSIIIPAYNESKRIGASLERIVAYAAQQAWKVEVLVVNDGSRDDTAEIVREFAKKHSFIRLLENPGNRGKGYTVRNGILNARGDLLLFTDADLSSPIEEAPKLFNAIKAGADVAIGSRWLQAELQRERQPFHRQVFGRIFNIFLRAVLGLPYKDTQCGFKAFTHGAARAVFGRQRITGWGFDPEILFLARKMNFRIQEVPVAWAHDDRSKINPITDGIKMAMELLKIRWTDVAGKYDKALPTYVVTKSA